MGPGFFSDAQRENKGQTGTQESLNKHEEKIIYCEVDRALELAAQKDPGVFYSGDIQNPLGCFPEQFAVGSLL